MADTSRLLGSLLAHVPGDLSAYFTRIADGSFSDHDDVEVNLLPIAEAVRWTNDLPEFLDAARCSIDDDVDLRTYHPKGGILIDDQTGLNRLIADLYDENNDGVGKDVVLALISSSNLIADGLYERMANDDDFYIAEAIGDTIAHRPRPTLESLAMVCRNHSHPQASRAGERAMAAIKALQ
jgi:hypothetical protein